MSQSPEFAALLRRLRDGDPAAAAEFVARYGRAVRITAHVLRRRLNLSPADIDSEEVQLSVLGSFCIRARLGQYELDSEDALRGLLHRMAHNKVIDCARKRWGFQDALAAKARQARAGGADSGWLNVLIEEMMAQARALCDAEEWRLIQLRAADGPWEEIGAAFGEKADTVRKRYGRLVRRIEEALDLPGADDE
jgi:DNA-directed RNA polymerase specialized sigma24 family protein